MFKGPWILIQRKAPHIGHSQHICDIVECGETTLEQMKNLVRDPKFICNKCGRAAAKEENLCAPKLL